MTRRPLAATLVAVAVLAIAGCATGPTATWSAPRSSRTASPSTSGTPSPTPSPTASATASTPPSLPPSTQGNPPRTTPPAQPPPPPPPPPPADNAAYCSSVIAALERTEAMLGPLFTVAVSTDPTEVEQAWQEIERLATEGAGLAEQAIGQTNDDVLKSVAQIIATHLNQVAAAAAARDIDALAAIPEPQFPEPVGPVCDVPTSTFTP